MPLVYIILVNYNGYEDTIECVKSLEKVTYRSYKIIIVDNDSNDDSIDNFNRKLDDCIIISSKENLGFAGGNNLGIKYALSNNADYILLLNNDTIVESEFLNNLVKLVEDDQSIGIVGGKIYYYDNPTIIWYAGGKLNSYTGKTKHIGINEMDRGQYDSIYETDYVTGCMMLVSRQAIEKAGLMDENYFLYYEETDWNIRIKNNGFKIMYTPYARIYHKISASTKKINDVVGYYYDRNGNYFIHKNFKLINKIFMYCYIRTRLFLKLSIAIIKKKGKKKKIIKYTFYSIKNGIMGKANL